jgi:ABC-type polysaccharide/polyol phosphate export permease
MKKQRINMLKNYKNYLKTFWQLLKTDLIIFKQHLITNIINCFVWLSISIIVFAYIFPNLGMEKGFAGLWLAGSLATWAIFEAWPSTITFLTDIEGNNSISYQLSLPIPSWMIFAKRALGYAINTMATGLMILPIGKLLLWNRVNFTDFSIMKFLIIFITMNIFANTFSHFLITLVHDIHSIEKAFIRIMFPMWFLGGANFPWHVINKMSPILGKIILANPFIYMMEGIRVAVLGQENFLPFWYSITALLLFTALFGLISIKRLKKRLDFI